MTLAALIAGACAIGLALCWAHARRDDQVWGNRWGDPDPSILPPLTVADMLGYIDCPDEVEGP